MRKVLKGEEVKKWDRIDGQCVVKHHVTEHGTLGNVETTWVFDFDGVSREELMVLAARHLVIAVRSRFKKSKPNEAEEWEKAPISVRKHLDTARTPDPEKAKERAKKALGALTPEQVEALLAEHNNVLGLKKGKKETKPE